MSVVLGMALAVGLAFGIEYPLDDTVKTPDDVQRKLNLPLLGLVPSVRGERAPLLAADVPHRFRRGVQVAQDIAGVHEPRRRPAGDRSDGHRSRSKGKDDHRGQPRDGRSPTAARGCC